jgi:hypothetical protein
VSARIFWPCFAGVVFLVMELLAVRKESLAALRLNKLIVLGRVFIAAPLAVFGAEHLVGAQSVMQVVPPWMPARLFWAYFVGFSLIAAAISIVLMKYVRLSATLLGVLPVRVIAASAESSGEPERQNCMGDSSPRPRFRRGSLGSCRSSDEGMARPRLALADSLWACVYRDSRNFLRGRTFSAPGIRARRSPLAN